MKALLLLVLLQLQAGWASRRGLLVAKQAQKTLAPPPPISRPTRVGSSSALDATPPRGLVSTPTSPVWMPVCCRRRLAAEFVAETRLSDHRVTLAIRLVVGLVVVVQLLFAVAVMWGLQSRSVRGFVARRFLGHNVDVEYSWQFAHAIKPTLSHLIIASAILVTFVGALACFHWIAFMWIGRWRFGSVLATSDSHYLESERMNHFVGHCLASYTIQTLTVWILWFLCGHS